VISRRPLQLVALLILLLGAGTTAAAPTAARAKDDLRELRGKIEALQKRLADAEESKTEAADALRESERAISDANRSLRDLAQQSRDVKQRLAGLRAASRDNESTLKTRQAQLAKLLYQQYLGGRSDPLKLLLNHENPNEIARQMHYFSYISRAHAALIASLRSHLARLRELAQEVEQQLAELTAITARQAVEKRRLEQEKRARGKVLAGIAHDIQQQKRKIGTLKRDENRLTKLVEQLGRIIARTPSRPSPVPRLKNERLPDSTGDGTPFQQLKGKLHLPVRGELGNRFGSPRSDSGLNWKGLFIAARPGEEVHAIAAGRVVFADWLRGFGNLLIIDHGDSYMSLYGNNETLYKQVGDTIRGGETIAAVGNSGGNTDSGLYFEIRYQGKPFDPLTWVNAR
jgi:septal ring factor EnvC (AmiA/AmiB activator)